MNGTIAGPVQNTNTGLFYCTIQAAIDAPATLTGHTIVASANTYNEQVNVTKALIIRGANFGIAGNGVRGAESIVNGGAGARSGFVVTASPVSIDGFTVTGCGGPFNSGLYNAPGTVARFINNIVSDNVIGAAPNGGAIIRGNLFDANNRPGAAGGTGIYTESSNGMIIDQNEFKGHTINSAVIFGATVSGAHTNLKFTKNYIHNNNNTNSMVYCVAVNNSLFKENNITEPGTTAIKFAGGCNNDTVSYNTLNNNGTGIKIANDGFAFGANGPIEAHYNHLASNTIAGVQNDDLGTFNATCNWYGTVFGPVIATNLGGTGSAVAGSGNKTYANWLNYGIDASANIGVQLPTAISVTAGSNLSMANNHYRLLSNAVGCLVDNQTLTVNGTFNFGNGTAQPEWAKGNDQIAGGVNALDDYTILAPSPVINATVTATSLGSATIQGPGDLPNVALETPFFFNNDKPNSSNQGWTISNLIIRDFDGSILAFLDGAGNTTAFNNFKVLNNRFDIPTDLNATSGGESGANNLQNIGIHYSFGTNQEFSGNTFNIDGTGNSDGTNRSTTIAMQSNTSGGTVYDGLKITNNTFNVTGDPDPTGEAVIRGIWENGHNTDAGIEISGNTFSNASATNLANQNRQFAMWQTSHSGSTKNVVYKNNEFSGWNTGISALGGPFTANTAPDYNTGELPVLIQNNKFDKMQFGVVVRKSAGSTNAGSPMIITENSFTNGVTGGFAISNESTGTTTANCNWYGRSFNVAPFVNGAVNFTPWLIDGTDNSPAVGFQPVPGSCAGPLTNLYVNDNSLTGDHYTTAVGNNSNNGTPAAPFATIAFAISVSNPGDTIWVDAGTYVENPVVNKTLTINGSNKGTPGQSARPFAESLVRTNGNQTSVFTFTSSNVNVDGFTVDGDDPSITGGPTFSGDDANTSYGFRLQTAGQGSNDTIRNNIVVKTAIGVRGDVVGQGSLITGNWFDRIGNYDFGYAVTLRNNFYANVTNNKMTKSWTGIHLNNHNGAGGPATWTVSGNEIHSYAGGLLYWLQFNNATSLTANNNQITAEATAVANNFGILAVSIQDAINPSFTNNTVTGTNYGFGLFNVPTSNTLTLGATNTITGTTLSAILLTNNLNFNPIGTTNFLAGGPGAASTVNVSGVTLNPATGNGIEVVGTAGTAPANTQTLNVNAATVISGGTNGLAVNGTPTAITGSAINNLSFAGQTGNYITLTGNALAGTTLDATGSSFDGTTGAAKTVAQNFATEDKITHCIDNAALGFVLVKANNDFVTTNSFVTPATTTASVQRAVDAASPGFTVNVADGTYNGDVFLNQANMTVLGQSTNAIIRGLYAGATKSVTVSANNVTVKDVTITRDFGATFNGGGNDWVSSAKTEGIIAENVTGLVLDHIIVEGNRNGVYIHSVPGFIVRNSTIRNNRTGFQIWGNLDNGQIVNNFIINNFTHGVLVNFGQGLTTGNNLLINQNDISGNWQSQINFQNNVGPGTNVGSFAGFNANCNWYGTLFPAYEATDPAYPMTGYGDQVPSQFGGTDPGLVSDIRGNNAALITYVPYLDSGVDAASGYRWLPACWCLRNAERPVC